MDLAEMEKGLKKSSDIFLLDMIKAYLEETDRQIAKDKTRRREEGLVVERRSEERTVYTRFGTLTYSRSYYYNKRKKAYLHPVDLVAGLEPYERISLTVGADMVSHAAESSYGESSLPAGRQVALQDGSNTNLPIITVHEGIKKPGKNRSRCINTHHICAYGETSEDLWFRAADWIYEAYDIDKIEAIYIHGDGASWIKKGLEILPKSKPVLDKYHLNKAIMNCTGAPCLPAGRIQNAGGY